MDEKRERQLRRRAVRLRGVGRSLRAIGAQLRRSPQWVAKWLRRFRQAGSRGLRSRSRRPRACGRALPPWVSAQVVRLRKQLVRARIGLIGAPAIRRAWHQQHLPAPPPSVTTIKRILHRTGQTHTALAVPAAYYPAPRPTPAYPLHALDWTERYLERGVKVYAFHTLDLASRAVRQTISPNKAGATVRQHTLDSWQSLGIPAFLQLDNDTLFMGGYRGTRVIGQFVRLCLYVGVELIFLPLAEPKRNGVIESFHQLWGKALFDRRHFRFVAQVHRTSRDFEQWYLYDYAPPALAGETPAQVAPTWPRPRRLTDDLRQVIPASLPITAGRIHFIRLVGAQGTLRLLNEDWRVGRRWAGQYVWATINTARQTLSLFHRHSSQSSVQRLRVYPYPLPQPVAPLLLQFGSDQPRRRVSTML